MRSGELDNLAEDVGERRDVAPHQPEVARQLRALVEAVNRDPGVSELGSGVRTLGRAQTTRPWIANDPELSEVRQADTIFSAGGGAESRG
ncbi:MAG: hypothetical protein N2652_03060 [Kiritimatiellae bacterium]|nr:hypothetical protein [Kiritimatiellia bacterium]